MSILQTRTLVINRNYQPVRITTLKRALVLLCKDLAVVVCPPENNTTSWQEIEWEDWMCLEPINDNRVRSVRACFRVPEIVKLTGYDGYVRSGVKVSRRNIYLRDQHTCQYCGKKPDYEEFTIDHVVPKARGGRTTWENCVLACEGCNRRKADKTVREAGMRLLSTPVVPAFDMLHGRSTMYESWRYFLNRN